MMTKHAFIAFALALAALCGCSNSGDSAKEPPLKGTVVTIGYLPITHALALFEEKEELALDESADISIKLQKFGNWSDLTDALNAGQIDGASVLVELAMSAKSKGVDLKAVALGHKDGNVIVASKEIESAADLKGKTIAIPSTQSSHFILVQDELRKAGLTTDDVTIVQLSPTEMPFALASGSIQAFCVAEPFGAQAVSKNIGRALDSSENLWEDSLCCALVLNQKAIDRLGPEKVQEFVERYHAAGRNLDSQTAQNVAQKYLGQDPEILKTSLKWISYDDLRITPEDYQLLCDKVKEYGISDNPPAYDEFVAQFQEK